MQINFKNNNNNIIFENKMHAKCESRLTNKTNINDLSSVQ